MKKRLRNNRWQIALYGICVLFIFGAYSCAGDDKTIEEDDDGQLRGLNMRITPTEFCGDEIFDVFTAKGNRVHDRMIDGGLPGNETLQISGTPDIASKEFILNLSTSDSFTIGEYRLDPFSAHTAWIIYEPTNTPAFQYTNTTSGTVNVEKLKRAADGSIEEARIRLTDIQIYSDEDTLCTYGDIEIKPAE